MALRGIPVVFKLCEQKDVAHDSFAFVLPIGWMEEEDTEGKTQNSFPNQYGLELFLFPKSYATGFGLSF